jgi:hypothetical protein
MIAQIEASFLIRMIDDRTLERLVRDRPNHSNTNPWNISKEIKCADIHKRYQSCKEADLQNPMVIDQCRRLKRFTYQCFSLEKKYFTEFLKGEMTEEQYFDQYMEKVASSMRILPRQQVWEEKDEPSN